MIPNKVILLSGKRKSGKDYFTGKLTDRLVACVSDNKGLIEIPLIEFNITNDLIKIYLNKLILNNIALIDKDIKITINLIINFRK